MPRLLPPELSAVLERVDDLDERRHLKAFFEAASKAIDALSELDLSLYEPQASLGVRDLSMWKQLEPVVASTVAEVERLIEVTLEQFPPQEDAADVDVDSGFDDLISGEYEVAPPESSGPQAPTQNEVTGVVQSICANLKRDLAAFTPGAQSESIIQDHWNLLDYLGQFRGKFRAAIGEMVYTVARIYQLVHKKDVVPHYHDDIEEAVTVRAGTTHFRRRIASLAQKLDKAQPADFPDLWDHALQALDVFRVHEGYVLMRASDKRSLLTCLAQLEKLNPVSPDPRLFRQGIEGLEKFLDSLSVINRRETLLVHDKETVRRMQWHLAGANRSLLMDDIPQAQRALADALVAFERLYGRNDDLDDLIDTCRRVAPDQSPRQELETLVRKVEQAIAEIPLGS